ncbi:MULTISPECIES: hypothetical protein [Bacillus]|uniref:hypothetical protein n=1 Tax=Bacillus TaxID=1386 RepID=UPI000BF26F96|nr:MULTISPECIES: hypothetical protein [Bacillus]PFQ72420.1 hypothetical protein COK15_28185 [Bacillus cereus]PKJ52687.1 hypothetical protein CWE34_26565 [Bacillus sp. SN10]
MAKKLPPAKDWQARDIKDWNSHTFYAYLCAEHRKRRGIDYFSSKGITVDMTMIKRMYQKHGNEATKMFIDECLKRYTGGAKFKVATFWFMSTYMQAQVMPDVQLAMQRQSMIAQEETEMDDIEF